LHYLIEENKEDEFISEPLVIGWLLITVAISIGAINAGAVISGSIANGSNGTASANLSPVVSINTCANSTIASFTIEREEEKKG
jgi:hypothetical protein